MIPPPEATRNAAEAARLFDDNGRRPRAEFPDAARFFSCLRDPAFLAAERRRVEARRRWKVKAGASRFGVLLRCARLVRKWVRSAIAAEVTVLVAELRGGRAPANGRAD